MKRIVSCLTALMMSAAMAASQDWLYQGKPIDPLCFFDQEENNNMIDLTKCGHHKYKVTDINVKLKNEGFIGYNWQDQNADYTANGYSYYQVFSAGAGRHWLYTINNGGGTGEFTSIYLAKRNSPTTLALTLLTGGDRCNGGIQHVSTKDNKLTYSQNLTAYDLFELANINLPSIKAYDNLAACAVCCVAKAYYQIDENLKPSLLYIELNQTDDLPTQGTNQACFNQLYRELLTNHQTKINLDTLKQFVTVFANKCSG